MGSKGAHFWCNRSWIYLPLCQFCWQLHFVIQSLTPLQLSLTPSWRAPLIYQNFNSDEIDVRLLYKKTQSSYLVSFCCNDMWIIHFSNILRNFSAELMLILHHLPLSPILLVCSGFGRSIILANKWFHIISDVLFVGIVKMRPVGRQQALSGSPGWTIDYLAIARLCRGLFWHLLMIFGSYSGSSQPSEQSDIQHQIANNNFDISR